MPKATEERIIDLPYDTSARRAGGGTSSSGGGGSTTFLGLTDTPSTYSGSAGKVAKVNSGATAIEFGAVATATPTASAIVIADSDGKIGAGWLDDADISKTFLELTDTPSAYTGESLKLVRVNVGETALEFVASSGSGYTQEEIEDFTAAQFTGNTGVIDATYDDGTGAITLTLDVSAADRILYSTGADAWAETALTSFARTLLDDADAATARTTLGVVAGGAGDIWVEKAGDSMTGNLAIASTATTGNSLSIIRNLTAGSTDSPVVYVNQDHAGDDQPALRVNNDGTGNALEVQDGGTTVFLVDESGFTGIREANPDTPLHMNYTTNGGAYIKVENTNAGSSAQAGVQAESDAGSSYFGAGSTASVFSGGGFFYTAANVPLTYWTNNTKRVHIPGDGGMGIGNLVPQGWLHAHDGTGGMLFVTKTGINATPTVVVANGTGDVTAGLYFMATIVTSGGAFFGTSNVIANGSSLTIYSNGGDTLRLRVNADGSVDLTRTGGSLTYTVSLFMIWQ